ncbi:hypothetical protein J5X84_34420 [Streptosporangiaceae bacterium NEAU-GS5]|nr:hypothetical protein [Streptosporangiaceae bacterium NEAU-GS5]
MPIEHARLSARFPEIPAGRGHYESFYLKACHPSEPLGLWIRYTVHKQPGALPTGSVWFTRFSADGPIAVKVTVPDVSVAPGMAVVIGAHGHMGDGFLAGDVPGASWDLRFDGSEEPLRHLPREWMYKAPIPRTKLTSPYPDITVSGRVVAAGEEFVLDGWRGMIGHNWGAEHAERWIWLHGTDFATDPSAWFDVAIGRIRVGGITLPWVANGVLCLDGVRHRLGGLERIAATQIRELPDGCAAVLPGKGVKVWVRVSAPEERFAEWVYEDPSGGEHHVLNCSIAAMELQVEGASPVKLSTTYGAAYELGTRPATGGHPEGGLARG